MGRRSLAASLVAVASMALAISAEATIVYAQPPVWSGDGTDVGHTYTSQTDPGLNGFRALDDFTLASDAIINEVVWWGVYLDANLQDGSPNTTTWLVRFQEDDAGVPGAVIPPASSIPAANVEAQLVGTGVFGAVNGATLSIYRFTARVPDFHASAGTTYWFSPLSLGPTFSPLFGWIEGSGGNHHSFQTGFINGDVNQTFVREDDRAFLLVSIPEPATWMLMLCAAAALALLKRPRAAA